MSDLTATTSPDLDPGQPIVDPVPAPITAPTALTGALQSPGIDPHQVLDGPSGSKILEYRIDAADHDLGAATVLNLARVAGHHVIALPDRVDDVDGLTHWRVQVAAGAIV